MTDHSQLVKRLREDVFYGDERMHKMHLHSPKHMEAADAIEALQARVEALEAGHRYATAWRVDNLTAAGKTCGDFVIYTEYDRVEAHLKRNGAKFCKVTPLGPLTNREDTGLQEAFNMARDLVNRAQHGIPVSWGKWHTDAEALLERKA